MVKHVVMWKMKGPSEELKRQQAARVEEILLALRGKIPGLLSLQVGVAGPEGEHTMDVVLITEHESWAALHAYQTHPEHQAAARVIGELRSERQVVDFATEG